MPRKYSWDGSRRREPISRKKLLGRVAGRSVLRIALARRATAMIRCSSEIGGRAIAACLTLLLPVDSDHGRYVRNATSYIEYPK